MPLQKNLLLGQWRLVMHEEEERQCDHGSQRDGFAGGVCEAVFGDGIWDFRPKAMYGIDHGIGETKLSDVDYRGNEGLIGVIPKMGKLFVFKILGPDRMQEVYVYPHWRRALHVSSASVRAREGASPRPTSRPGGQSAAVAQRPGSPCRNRACGRWRVVDGAAFRCPEGSLLHVSMCQGGAAEATCKLTELHRPGLQIGTPPRARGHRGAREGVRGRRHPLRRGRQAGLRALIEQSGVIHRGGITHDRLEQTLAGLGRAGRNTMLNRVGWCLSPLMRDDRGRTGCERVRQSLSEHRRAHGSSSRQQQTLKEGAIGARQVELIEVV